MTSTRTALLLAASLVVAIAGGARATDESPPSARKPTGQLPAGAGAAPSRQGPYHDDGGAITEGRRLFVAFNCYGCHGGRGGGGMGPSLRDPDWIYGGSDEDIFNSIADGRANGMPAWGGHIPADMIWRLTAYVTSLGTAREADPPR